MGPSGERGKTSGRLPLSQKSISRYLSSKTGEDPQKPDIRRYCFPGNKRGKGDGIVLVAGDVILECLLL